VQVDDGAASITVCDDGTGVDESTRLAAEWVRTNAAGAIAGPPVVMAGEMVVAF
jgi:hypothetical protein